MFLKSLSVKGFKSFGEPATLDLEPGVCVVVGPNGSGKSNIIDAIAWVLGAQAPRTVRSQKMDDVIFAGTAKKQALGRAEVSLTIDNSAGRLPIEFTEVTITRRLFRSGDSEYELNGAPCRLLDITELLSDSGVGRTQHVIVSQGNLDGVLNARPEERRSVIEEAAGILKHRRRRERSQRRLESTEQNLVRIHDMVREVRRQLGPLRKQADAALRHQGVVDELRALKIHLAGRELAGHKRRMEEAAAQRAELARVEGEQKRELAAMDTAVLAAEAEVSGTEAVAGAQRLADRLRDAESLRERARGVQAVLVERARSVRTAMQASVDADLVASLEADAARVKDELDEVDTEEAGLQPDATAVAQAEADLEVARTEFETEWAEGQLALASPADGAPTLTAAEVRGELGALRAAAERAQTQRARVAGRLAAMTQRGTRLETEAARLADDIAAGEAKMSALQQAVVEAVNQRAKAEEQAAVTTDRKQTTATDAGRWEARAEALAQALDEARARAGAGRLAGVDGVVGTLLELVDIDEGWAEAVEAALGEAVAAVVVDGSQAARRALEVLTADHHGGAVLPLPETVTTANEFAGAGAGAPAGTEAVRTHTRGVNPGVEALLDRLLTQAWCTEGDWGDALDLAIAHPRAVIVTRQGDRFGQSSWRAGAGAVGATGAALDEARRRASEAHRVADEAGAAMTEAARGLSAARQAEQEASRTRSQTGNRTQAAKAALDRQANERRDVAAEVRSLTAEVAELDERAQREQARIDELAAALPDLEAEEARGRERTLAQRAARSRLDQQVAAVAARRKDLDVRVVGLQQRRRYLEDRRHHLDQRLDRLAQERAEAEIRRRRLESHLRAIEQMGADIAADAEGLDQHIGALRAEREQASAAVRAVTERLEGMRRDRQLAEQRLGVTRERAGRAEIEEAEVGLRVEALVEGIRRDLDTEPDAALAAPLPALPEATSAESRVRELERDLRLMGPVNPLAVEELAAVEERATFVQAELDDVQKSRRELAKVIRAIDAEIVQVFAAAYADVAANFEQLFGVLFPGGTGRIRLTNPDDLLNTGVEIEGRPSGKNVRSLQLLSGGERSLVAMAYLFAVFRSRPSPFYCMDEVEAALDDVNLHRFLGLLDEFRHDAQLIVVSHQKRTMEAADCLYGVTMQPGGSSKVVSERVRST